jgi:hypothetical protein
MVMGDGGLPRRCDAHTRACASRIQGYVRPYIPAGLLVEPVEESPRLPPPLSPDACLSAGLTCAHGQRPFPRWGCHELRRIYGGICKKESGESWPDVAGVMLSTQSLTQWSAPRVPCLATLSRLQLTRSLARFLPIPETFRVSTPLNLLRLRCVPHHRLSTRLRWRTSPGGVPGATPVCAVCWGARIRRTVHDHQRS